MFSDIVLATINARYIHTAFGLRYLKANLKELETRAQIREFTLDQRPLDMVEQILSQQPEIVGIGVYIWNAQLSLQVVALIKKIAPQVVLVLGGPEVSHEQGDQQICALADHVLAGPAEGEFYALCKAVLNGRSFTGVPALAPDQIKLPYYLYTDEDLAHRIVYVEASRGCPFRCEFCLSALDRTARPFVLQRFLTEMQHLYDRGARHFKFVDRTFNLSTRVSLPIMQFFLHRISEGPPDDEIFVHFEVIPDRLPVALKDVILQFPPGSLQFEVGVQTFNQEVQKRISRKQDDVRTRQNLAWLCQQSPAHVHADLIFGLPGENIDSMAQSFERLLGLQPDEIQLGMLKRLRGMPMTARQEQYGMLFNPAPPYDILSTREVSFENMQRLRRMARYWDLVANSGRFRHSLKLILGEAPFARFMHLSEWLHRVTGQTHKISLKRLFDLLFDALTTEFGIDIETARVSLRADYECGAVRGLPQCLRSMPGSAVKKAPKRWANKRQRAHMS